MTSAFSVAWNFITSSLYMAMVSTLSILAVVFLYGFYNVFFHPLRHYPGPLTWRAFRFPYVLSIHRAHFHQQLKGFHDKYGPIVRVAPNELSYADGAAWKDVYGNRPGHKVMPRNPAWARPVTPNDPHAIMTTDEAAHARLRRVFAQSFSEKSLRDQAPVVESYLDLFISQLRSRSKSPVDLMQWLNFLTFDISGDLSFGESFDCVQNGTPHPWVEIASDFGKGVALLASINYYPPLDKLLRYVIPAKLRQRQIDHREMTGAKMKKRLALQEDRPDFVTPVKKFGDKNTALTDAEWEVNMSIVVFAGSETTGSALTGIMRQLLQNQGALHRLVDEIRDAFEKESDVTVASTGNLPYLNAVINEGLRIAPPVVVGVPRIVPQGGDMICGKWVPGGTHLAVHQYPTNRQPHNFHSPNTFLPERFLTTSLTPDSKNNNNKTPTDDFSAFQPFGIGRHSCIGLKLAYAEMRIILARLLFVFDVQLEDENDRWDWGEQGTFIFWEKRPLRVKLGVRTGV